MDATSYLLGKKSSGGGSTQEFTIKSGTTGSPGYQGVIAQIPSLNIDDTSCKYMFYNYKGILPKLKGTNNVTDMQYMFARVTELDETTIFNSFDTTNVTNMNNMFDSSGFKKLDLSKFNTSNVEFFSSMFAYTSNLSILDISNFDFSKSKTMINMFQFCGNTCKQVDGAYADGIPFVYVKNATAQDKVLTATNTPGTWTTNNVVIKNS